MYHYPSDLAAAVPNLWNRRLDLLDKPVKLPPPRVIRTFLEVAYHGSFTVDEGRPARFTVAFRSERQWESYWQQWGSLRTLAHLRFGTERDYSVPELRRLASATDPLQSLVMVSNFSRPRSRGISLRIVGLLSMARRRQGGITSLSSSIPPPPVPFLAVRVMELGTLTVLRSGHQIAQLRNGAVSAEVGMRLKECPAMDGLAISIEALRSEVATALAAHDDYHPVWSSPLNEYHTAIERLLSAIRKSGHGGTVILVPDDVHSHDPRLVERLRVKYSSSDDRLWRWLVESIVATYEWDRASAVLGDAQGSLAPDAAHDLLGARETLDWSHGNLAEAISFLAHLSQVDGAIVLTDRLRLVGFAAALPAAI